ncbi:PD-(D/E)XK nuclease family protein [bacterium]|nr:PD-(D/E)XK nuclease family protein [bacterium]MBU4133856.1 PD-(D/E)XK nuclease family protein [bacterium]
MKTDIVFIDGEGAPPATADFQPRQTKSCGKTSFLLSKFEELIAGGSDVSRILVLCPLTVKGLFTEAVRRHRGAGSGELHIDSFSGFAKWALKKNCYQFTRSCDFTIISGKEEEAVLKDILSRAEVRNSLKVFSSCCRFGGFITDAVNFIDSYKINPSAHLSEDEFIILSEYKKRLKERNLFDLRDVENCCLESASSGFFSENFDYIFLDGWEDINRRETEIFIRLIEKSANLKGLYIAGDASRGIYDFLGGDAEGTRRVFEEKFGDYKKKLAAYAEPGFEVMRFLSAYDEAGWILSEIKKLLSGGEGPDDIAVISRDTGDEIKMLEDMAAMEGVPVSCPSGAPFFKHPQFLAFLSFLYFTADMDEKVSFPDMLALPVFKMDAADIFRYSEGRSDKKKELSLKVEKVRAASRGVIKEESLDITSRLKKLYVFSGSESLSADDIIANRLFGKFFEYAEKFHNIIGDMKFDIFISFLSDSLSTFARAPYLGDIPDTVKLLTVHEAKGSHFKYVFIPGAVWGKFPRKFSPGVYLKTSQDEEKHFATEEKIFRSALFSGTEKVCVSFALSENEETPSSPYIEEFLKSIPVGSVQPRMPFSVEMEMVTADKVSCAGIKNEISRPGGLNASVSVSSLESYISCPLKFLIENIIALEKRISEPALCGQLVHRIMEKFHAEFPVPGDKDKMTLRMAALTSEVFSSNPAEEFDSRHSAVCWRDFFYFFLRKYAEGGNVFDVVEREKSITVKVAGVNVTGRIDRVDKVPGGYEIIDYKTSPGGKFKALALRNQIKKGEHLALPVYAEAVGGCSDITLFWLADYEKPGDYPLKVTLKLNDEKTASAVSEMKIKLTAAAKAMKEGDFYPAPSCPRRGCPYEYLCQRLKGADIYER